jgi:membrane protein YdbS with pleckstrin-like domain
MTEWTPETIIAASVAGEAPQTTPEAFSALEPEVIALWRLNGGIEWAILLSVTFVIITVGSIMLSLGLWFWALLAAWVLALVVAVVQTIWYPPLAYRYSAYRITDRVIEVRHGVWFRESRLIPLSRIQHIDLRQGLFERSYGLANPCLPTPPACTSRVRPCRAWLPAKPLPCATSSSDSFTTGRCLLP